jgi:glutamate/tyrosine decarboxylase-like PLP-dependent enzyme
VATTTVALIRAQLVTVLEALTPSGLNAVKYRRAPKRHMLAQLAKGTSSHTRLFAIQAAQKPEKAEFVSSTQKQFREQWDLIVAYPVLLSQAGVNEMDDLEDAIRADMFQIEDAVFSPGNYLSAVNRMDVVDSTIEKGDGIWFARFVIEIDFYAAQTLT